MFLQSTKPKAAAVAVAAHGGGCSCCAGAVPMQQSLEEVDFERGLWGYIVRGASAEQVDRWVADRGAHWADAKDKAGYTPLLYASRRGDAAMCRVLLRRGASVNTATPGMGLTSLHRAASLGHTETVKVLLDAGADASLLDAAGKNAVEYATEKDHPEVIMLFVA
jgi:hypothetical protein